MDKCFIYRARVNSRRCNFAREILIRAAGRDSCVCAARSPLPSPRALLIKPHIRAIEKKKNTIVFSIYICIYVYILLYLRLCVYARGGNYNISCIYDYTRAYMEGNKLVNTPAH